MANGHGHWLQGCLLQFPLETIWLGDRFNIAVYREIYRNSTGVLSSQ